MAPNLTTYILDTRPLWPGPSITLSAPASPYLALLPTAELTAIISKHRLLDAKMSLGSALLKRWYASRVTGVPWWKVRFGRRGRGREGERDKEGEKHGKPCVLREVEGEVGVWVRDERVRFNVSHQNGLVVLVGWNGYEGDVRQECDVGVDIVCVDERYQGDMAQVDEVGFDGFVDVFEEVFGEEERWDVKYNIDGLMLNDGTAVSAEELGRLDRCVTRDKMLSVTLKNGQTKRFHSELIIDAKLRRFYAFFCYKEAYIKLVGEGLLAAWLKELEFKHVRAPKPGTVARCSTHGTWGEKVEDVEIWLHGKRVENVKMQLQAFEENFMIATAVEVKDEGTNFDLPEYTKVNVADILEFAEED